MKRWLRQALERFTAPSAAPSSGRFPRIEVFEWQPRDKQGRPTETRNFGDHLATVVTSKLLADHGFGLGEEAARTTRLFTVGSVLHFAASGDTVWGSGVNGKIAEERHRFTSLDVRAVRGPLTAEFLRKRGIACPEVYGDPALLIPRLFPGRFVPRPTVDHVVVPNLHDLGLMPETANIVSPLSGWNRVIERIMSARLVIASSLHGLIIADAFGVPARFLRLSETESLFKYRDYALGAGRPEMVPASSVAEALEMGPMECSPFDPGPLMKAFPLDLWS